MPGARQRVRYDVRNRDAIEVLALDRIMRGDGAKHDLGEKEADRGIEIFDRRTHRGRRLVIDQGIGRRRLDMFLFALAGLVPGQKADAGDQEQDAGDRPHAERRRRHIADERFVRPVVGIADHIVRTLRDAGPSGPEKEGAEPLAVLIVRQRTLRNRIIDAQGAKNGVAAEQLRIMRTDLGDRLRPFPGDGDRPRRGVIAVGPKFGFQPVLEGSLLFGGQLGEGRNAFGPGPDFEKRRRFAMQPVGAPVGRDIAAMAPDRAELHAAQRLPDLPPRLDIGLAEKRVAIGDRDGFGNRRCLDIDFPADEAEDREGENEYRPQPQP